MRYALNKKKDRIEVSFSGELAKCEICDFNVKGRKGDQRIKHWYHHEKKTIDCDNWYERISEWHLNWQNQFPKKYREASITENNVSHRADILLNNGLVIEFQNSPIKFSDIEKRESFYGKNKMIWVLNGQNLISKCILTKNINNYKYLLTISIPKTFKREINYDFKYLLKLVLEDTDIGTLRNKITPFEIKNEHTLSFKFTENQFELKLIEAQYKYYIACTFERLYSQTELEKFRKLIRINYSSINETTTELILFKKYWRKFIDQMKFPVFIDNLSGVNENELYYLTENKVIDKKKFINYYLRYT